MNNSQKTILELESLYETDQDNITSFKKGEISDKTLADRQRMIFEYIKHHIQKHGFPYIQMTSEKAYTAAILAVQHSGDSEYMRKIIVMMQNAKDADIHKRDLGFLIDRCLVLQNKPQIYGTQYRLSKNSITFFEIENKTAIDIKRKELSMESFEEYIQTVKNNIEKDVEVIF